MTKPGSSQCLSANDAVHNRGKSVVVVATTTFIANTDCGWFSHFLHRAEPPYEVNFWQPSPHGFEAIPTGAPFFFRLGAPHGAIAGNGFFARYERVLVWIALGNDRDVKAHCRDRAEGR